MLLRELPKSIPSRKLTKKLTLRSRRVHRRAQGAPCWESTGVRRSASGGRRAAACGAHAAGLRAAGGSRTRCWQWECAWQPAAQTHRTGLPGPMGALSALSVDAPVGAPPEGTQKKSLDAAVARRATASSNHSVLAKTRATR